VGLRLVRRLAQQLGGNLEVRTGMGTEVRVRFKPY
jgi:two-component sensor histidine kinase